MTECQDQFQINFASRISSNYAIGTWKVLGNDVSLECPHWAHSTNEWACINDKYHGSETALCNYKFAMMNSALHLTFDLFMINILVLISSRLKIRFWASNRLKIKNAEPQNKNNMFLQEYFNVRILIMLQMDQRRDGEVGGRTYRQTNLSIFFF